MELLFFEESSRTGCGYFIKKINIGNSSFENILVAEVGKINNFGFTKSKKKIDGILGFDFLKRVGLFVSPTNKTIQFTNHIKNPEEYFSFSFDEEMFKKNRFAFIFKYDDKIKNCF